MVSTTTRDEMTWYVCDACGLMFDSKDDAKQHEANCDAEEPSYIQ
jgi:rubredoxin